MVKAAPKVKITYHEPNLSAFAIFNFVKSIDSSIKPEKAKKPNIDRPEFYWVELSIDSQVFYGELSIMDYVASLKNREIRDSGSGTPIFHQGTAMSLNFDDWVAVLNRRLRPATIAMLTIKDNEQAKTEAKENVKAIAKALED